MTTPFYAGNPFSPSFQLNSLRLSNVQPIHPLIFEPLLRPTIADLSCQTVSDCSSLKQCFGIVAPNLLSLRIPPNSMLVPLLAQSTLLKRPDLLIDSNAQLHIKEVFLALTTSLDALSLALLDARECKAVLDFVLGNHNCRGLKHLRVLEVWCAHLTGAMKGMNWRPFEARGIEVSHVSFAA